MGWVDGRGSTCLAHMINAEITGHGEQLANAELSGTSGSAGQRSNSIVAKDSIPIGTQILMKYGADYWRQFGMGNINARREHEHSTHIPRAGDIVVNGRVQAEWVARGWVCGQRGRGIGYM